LYLLFRCTRDFYIYIHSHKTVRGNCGCLMGNRVFR